MMIPKRKRILGMILGGGKGTRLSPLTRERTKPAVMFGGKYRIVDFVLSNFINSGLRAIYVLVQYKSQSLIEHLRISWRARGLTQDEFITVVPPQMMSGESWYRGTADAIAQNLNLVFDFNPDLVVVFGSDHVYRMDINQMIYAHIHSKADATVATLPMRVADAREFGVVGTDRSGRIKSFTEKPKEPHLLPGSKDQVLVSMGNYIFNTATLIEIIRSFPSNYESLDFGKDILPKIIPLKHVHAYNFMENVIPGLRPFEQKGYWRDIGTIEAYYEAHKDLLTEKPLLYLANPRWPIHSGRHEGPPAFINKTCVDNSIFGGGCTLRQCTVKNSIFGRDVVIEPGAVVEDSIVMDGTVIGKHAKVRRTIIDRFNRIPNTAQLGYGKGVALGTYFKESNILVIPRASRTVAEGT